MTKIFTNTFFVIFFVTPQVALSTNRLNIQSMNLASGKMPFLSHQGSGTFDNTLALNVPYAPIQSLRTSIGAQLGRELKFLTSWLPLGEAHVTVVTPVEYSSTLSHFLSMAEIEAIAKKANIQSADLTVFGIGSGKKVIAGKTEETFFLLVDSLALRKIRQDIYLAFVKKGGLPQAWDPTHWYPHITIGYTLRDLHEEDGIIKSIKNSWDPRF